MTSLSSCNFSAKKERLTVDVTKICSEHPKLVLKILDVSKRDFSVSSQTDATWGYESTWDLSEFKVRSLELEWLQLKYHGDRLQSIWLGPKQSLEKDMNRLGINTYFLKSATGESLDTYKGGIYYSKDLGGRKMTIEHGNPGIKGTLITCFKRKKRK